MTRLVLDRHGWLKPGPGVRRAASPNFDARPRDAAPYLLVIHNISLPPGRFGGSEVIDFFQNRLNYSSHPWLERLKGMTVSAHFFIRRTGEIVQLVGTEQRAWHAGVSRFEGRERCNDFSIGIELEGADTMPYTDAQYTSLDQLADVIRTRHPIRAVQGHQHIAPGRKTDPGEAFDWARFQGKQ
jgi:AmpD protein